MKKQQYLDLIERTAWTAVQAFAGVVIGMYATVGVDWASVFASAGIAAGIAVLKCLAGFRIGDSDTAALLPPGVSEPTTTKKSKK